MPTYEYRCSEGHEFDVFQKMSDEPVAECPVCGAESERLISAGAGLLFKGSGFYITDYRSPDYAEKAKSDAGGGEAKKAGDARKASGSGDAGGSSGSEKSTGPAPDGGGAKD